MTELVLQVDSPRAPVACDICDKIFSNKANMKRHRITHSEVKTFECPRCQKKFHRKDQIQEHWLTHAKPGSYFDCPVLGCEEKFSCFSHLKAHAEDEHVISAITPATCKHCHVHYRTARRLMIHYHTRDLFGENEIDLYNITTGSAHESMDVSTTTEGMGLVQQLFDSMPKLEPQRKRKRIMQQVKIEPESQEASLNNFLLSLVNQHCDLNFTSNEEPMIPINIKTEVPCQDAVSPSSNRSTPDSIGSGSGTDSSSESNFDTSRQKTPENTEQDTVAKVSNLIMLDSSVNGISLRPPTLDQSINIEMVGKEQTMPQRVEEDKYECKFCDISFKDMPIFMMHMGFHTRTEPFKCNMCGTSCANHYDFNAHLMYGDHRHNKFRLN